MITMPEEEFERRTAKRKAAQVTEIIQGKTRVAQASRTYNMPPSEIEERSRKAVKAWRTRCAPEKMQSLLAEAEK